MLKSYVEEEIRFLESLYKNNTIHHDDPDYSKADIDCLLQGTAYLAAKVRHAMDRDADVLSNMLLEQFAPQWLKPQPSYMVIQYSHHQRTSSVLCFPKGSYIDSAPVGEEQTACRFRSLHDVFWNPVFLEKAEWMNMDCDVLRWTFSIDPVVEYSKLFLDPLPMYLSADSAIAEQWYACLTHDVKSAHIWAEDTMPISITIQPFHAALDCGTQWRLYFSNCALCFFIAIRGLSKVALPPGCSHFFIEIFFKKKLDISYLSKELFQLHCGLFENEFSYRAEPIFCTGNNESYALCADVSKPNSILMHQIDAVEGISTDGGMRTTYLPFSKWVHRSDPEISYYQKMILDVDTPAISIVKPYWNISETLSCEITVSNGKYPERYIDLNTKFHFKSDAFVPFISVKLLTKPTAYLNPPEKEKRFCLISQWTLTHASVCDVEQLRMHIFSYDWRVKGSMPSCVVGIRSIAMQPISGIDKGSVWQGLSIHCVLDSACYESTSQIYLFSELLHHFFAERVDLYQRLITKVTLFPSEKTLLWQTSLSGNRYMF